MRPTACINFSLKNYGVELLELISTFTTAVCESWNVSNIYTWDNVGALN